MWHIAPITSECEREREMWDMTWAELSVTKVERELFWNDEVQINSIELINSDRM